MDPFVWTALRVLRQCRSFFATRDPEWQAFVEMIQVPFTAKTKVCGPAGVLKRYLQVMSLSAEVDGTIVFRNQARLHLLRCCYAELRNAVCEAWDDTVLARLRQRSGAEDLEFLDSSATRYVILLVCRSGAFISPFDALVPPASRLKSFRKVKASKAKGPRDTCLPYAVPKSPSPLRLFRFASTYLCTLQIGAWTNVSLTPACTCLSRASPWRIAQGEGTSVCLAVQPVSARLHLVCGT